jgi:hypothetical protein
MSGNEPLAFLIELGGAGNTNRAESENIITTVTTMAQIAIASNSGETRLMNIR